MTNTNEKNRSTAVSTYNEWYAFMEYDMEAEERELQFSLARKREKSYRCYRNSWWDYIDPEIWD